MALLLLSYLLSCGVKGVGREAVFAHIVCVPLRDWVCRRVGGGAIQWGDDTYHQWPFTPPPIIRKRGGEEGD